MTSEAFSTADRALHVQRRALAKELRAFLGDASSISGLSKEAFMEKKGYFEGMWKEVVSNTEGCISLLDDDADEDGHIAEGLNEYLEDLRFNMDRLNWWEEDLEKSLLLSLMKNK